MYSTVMGWLDLILDTRLSSIVVPDIEVLSIATAVPPTLMMKSDADAVLDKSASL